MPIILHLTILLLTIAKARPPEPPPIIATSKCLPFTALSKAGGYLLRFKPERFIFFIFGIYAAKLYDTLGVKSSLNFQVFCMNDHVAFFIVYMGRVLPLYSDIQRTLLGFFFSCFLDKFLLEYLETKKFYLRESKKLYLNQYSDFLNSQKSFFFEIKSYFLPTSKCRKIRLNNPKEATTKILLLLLWQYTIPSVLLWDLWVMLIPSK